MPAALSRGTGRKRSRMTEQSIAQSPLDEWWRSNRFVVDETCLLATRSVAEAARLRRRLKAAVEGELSIDDRTLRRVIGRLIAGHDDALEAIRAHRAWAKTRGGER